MTTTTQRSVEDHMTQLQLRLLQQRLDNEKEKTDTAVHHQGEELLSQAQKLQQAVQRRQELLDKLQEEYRRREELNRPRSHDRRRKYRDLSPVRPASLPDLTQGTPRHVVEHKFMTAPVPAAPQLPNIVQLPADASSRNWKGDMMEMMMMQNAQMHQMMVQQMMLSTISKNSQSNNQLSIPVTPDMLNLKPEKKEAVHHHHYGQQPQSPVQPPAQPNHGYTQLPPIYPPYPAYTDPYRSGRAYPWDVEPLRPPKPKKRKKKNLSRYYQPVRTALSPLVYTGRYVPKYPFPGPKGLRKFRQVAYAVLFACMKWKRIKEKRLAFSPSVRQTTEPNFLFVIQLKEAVAAIHKIYLEENSRIFPILRDVMAEQAPDLYEAKTTRDLNKRPLKDLRYVIENIVYYITEIMPPTGVLGLQKGKSVLQAMIEPAKRYPRGYLWDIEKTLLEVNSRNCIKLSVGEPEVRVLLTGLFFGRGLVTTLFLKPDEYGMVTEYVPRVADRNLKVLASLFLLLVRRVYSPPGKPPLAVPGELTEFVYRDEDILPLANKLKKSLDYSEDLIRNWAKEYYEKLRQS